MAWMCSSDGRQKKYMKNFAVRVWLLGRSRMRQKDNIKTGLRETVRKNMNRIELTENHAKQ